MTALDVFWHVLNLVAPAVGVGVLASAAAKLLWRRELKAVSWRRLALSSSSAGALVLLGNLVLFGHDGRMAAYAVMLLAAALALAWTGFGARAP